MNFTYNKIVVSQIKSLFLSSTCIKKGSNRTLFFVMTDKEACKNIMTIQRLPRIMMDNRIDDVLSSTLESYRIDECCVCAFETHSDETSEKMESFKRPYNTASVLGVVEPLYDISGRETC